MIRLLLTFDYELFLGVQSGTVEACLITPTSQLLRILSKHGLKAIFFVDTTYLIRLEEMKKVDPQAEKDWGLITDQLHEILMKGHSIFPHLHPHWLDAKYREEINEWDLSDHSRYRFDLISVRERDYLSENSVRILREIAAPVKESYEPLGFRAGGWSIQPFELFKPFFDRYQISFDFSVIPGRMIDSDAHRFDYTSVISEEPYGFEEDVAVEAEDGSFTEFPISSIELGRIQRWMNFKLTGLFGRLGFYDRFNGSTVSSSVSRSIDRTSSKNKHRQLATFEHFTPVLLLKYITELKHRKYFQFISHPKLLTTVDFKLLDLFLSMVTGLYEVNTELSEVADELIHE